MQNQNIYKKRITRHLLDGRRVPAQTPGAVIAHEESRKWYATILDGQGRRKEVSLSTDRGRAFRRLARLKDEAESERLGLIAPAVKHLRGPLATHLADYRVLALETTGKPGHVKRQVRRIERVAAGAGLVTLADLLNGKSRIGKYLSDERKRTDIRFGAVASNHHLAAVKAFSTWLVDEDRLPRHPLGGLDPVPVKGEERHPRRVLDPDDFARLLQSVRASMSVRKARRAGWRFDGLDRFRLYLTAARTGFRASELASLTRESFDFGAGTITVQAGLTKNREEAVLPLHPALADELRAWVLSLPEGRSLWPGRWADMRLGAKLLKPDLEAVGIPYRTAAGFFDFHSLRSQFACDLADAGVTPQEAKDLLRHSTIALTDDIYRKRMAVKRLAGAVAKLAVPTLVATA